MSEEVVETPNPPDDVETEAAALAVEMSGNRMVPLSALIGAKRELKTVRKELDDLKPVAARTKEIEEKLEAASPIIAAVQTNPRLMAEALRVVKGTPATSSRVEQPTEEDDPDAAETAETLGLFLADGSPDLVRARKTLNILDKRHGRQTEERLRPLAGSVLGSRAEQNVARALSLTDDDGVPLATRESIEEAVKLLGGPNAPMLANPQVADLLVTVASGLDRRQKRTPKAPDEPVYLERQGGGRRASAPAIDATLQAALERTGIKTDDAVKSISRLEHIGRKGVELGS